MSEALTDAEQIRSLVRRCGFDGSDQAGEPASSVEYRVDAGRTVALLATALAQLHSIDRSSLSADMFTATDIARGVERDQRLPDASEAERRSSQGPYRHIDRSRLATILTEGSTGVASRAGDPVLTHGAPTLSQLWCAKGDVVGFIGWERAALADPYRDLAIAARSVAEATVPVLVPVLFEQYGLAHPDPIRLDWYALADELTR